MSSWGIERIGDGDVRLSTGVLLPRRFLYRRSPTVDVDYHLEIEMSLVSERWTCERVTVRRKRGGAPVSGQALRGVAVATLEHEAVERAAAWYALQQVGRRRVVETDGAPKPGELSVGRTRRFVDRRGRTHVGPVEPPQPEYELGPEEASIVAGSSRAASDAGLADVARVYRESASMKGPSGRPSPRRAVAEHFGLTENQARELIRRVRRAKLL